MASVSQIILQQNREVKYVGGEPILPQEDLPSPDPMLSLNGNLPDGTDLGVVKVEEGKLVFDMPDFDADFGEFG